jgi:hypothetical protein
MLQNIFILFWKLLVYAFQIEILETFVLFNFDFKSRNSPSAPRVLAANAIDSDADIFNGRSVWANMIYYKISYTV